MAHLRITAAAVLAASIAAPAARDVAAQDIAPAFLIGVWPVREREAYRFESPSRFVPAELVPHFFEQRYDADHLWIAATARYTAGLAWESSAGFTPVRTATADDYDTFLHPDGTVWVSGTAGSAAMRAFRFEQRARIGRAGVVDLAGGYRWRLDRAVFGVGHKTVTRNGGLVEALDVTTRETTHAQLHEVFVGAMTTRRAGRAWLIELSADAAPTALGRLMIRLPDKYPGRDLTFAAIGLSAAGRVSAVRPGRWPVQIALDAGRVWQYRQTSAIRRTSLGVWFAIGTRM